MESIVIHGKQLIGWGYQPGPWFKTAIKAANVASGEDAARAAVEAVRQAFEAEEARKNAPPESVVGAANEAAPPVHVVGEHEQRTIDQLERCARYGSVAAAAIGADGHLGYAQPVGGVVAYREHISVSGVGFDIA